jgi:ribosomal-protein-alanine N-acetyltransferase
MSLRQVSVSALVEPLPAEGSADADALLALEEGTQERPLALGSILAEAGPGVDGVVLVARDEAGGTGGALVGMASARVQGDEAHVIRIAVDPAHRRRGVGRALLAALVAWARSRDASAVLLEVRATNVAAQQLYVAAGFGAEGRRRGYYPDGEDALLWRLALPGPGRD